MKVGDWVLRDFVRELEESDELARDVSLAIRRIIKENPDAELVFNVIWALHHHKLRKSRATTSKATAARMRAEGRRLGRPPVGISDRRVQRVKAMHKQGRSYREICKKVGVSVSTAHRYLTIRKPR